MTILDPVTGPLSRDEFKALASAPVGAALNAIRKHDPLYGYPPGHEIDWAVTVVREQEGLATVKAASLEEAKKLADNLRSRDIEWDVCHHLMFSGGEWDVVQVEPAE